MLRDVVVHRVPVLLLDVASQYCWGVEIVQEVSEIFH